MRDDSALVHPFSTWISQSSAISLRGAQYLVDFTDLQAHYDHNACVISVDKNDLQRIVYQYLLLREHPFNLNIFLHKKFLQWFPSFHAGALAGRARSFLKMIKDKVPPCVFFFVF